jgi:hypothetical protein
MSKLSLPEYPIVLILHPLECLGAIFNIHPADNKALPGLPGCVAMKREEINAG